MLFRSHPSYVSYLTSSVSHLQCWAHIIILSTRHVLPHHAVLSTRHRSVFLKFTPRLRRSATPSCVINFQLLKLVSTPIRFHTAGGQILPSPPNGDPHPSPPSGHLSLILLAAKLSLFRPAAILHPCWWQTSSLPIQRSSSTPAGCQPHPSPPSSHPPPLLAADLTPPHPAVIFHPSC